MDPREFKALKNKELLDKIAQLESSGGIDTNHKLVTSGTQAGERAIGNYGLMPNTLEEIKNRYPSDLTEDMSKEELAQKAKDDPEFAHQMAATLVSHLKDKRGLTDEETAAAWEQGHNKPVKDINLNTARARKFKVLNKK